MLSTNASCSHIKPHWQRCCYLLETTSWSFLTVVTCRGRRLFSLFFLLSFSVHQVSHFTLHLCPLFSFHSLTFLQICRLNHHSCIILSSSYLTAAFVSKPCCTVVTSNSTSDCCRTSVMLLLPLPNELSFPDLPLLHPLASHDSCSSLMFAHLQRTVFPSIDFSLLDAVLESSWTAGGFLLS